MTAVSDSGYGRQFVGFYDRLFPDGPDVEQTAALLAELRPAGADALELGVGTGRVALPLAARSGAVVGVDSSPEMLDVLRSRAEPGIVEAVHGDIRDFADGRRYGLVYCVCGTLSMLLTAEEQQQVLQTCARHLAPGGVLVIETHNGAVVEAMHAGRLRDSYFVPYPGADTGLLSYSSIDPQHRRWQLSHIFFDEGRAHIATETSRLTTVQEIDAYAAAAGLRPDARFGSWSGAAATGTEPMIIASYRADGPTP